MAVTELPFSGLNSCKSACYPRHGSLTMLIGDEVYSLIKDERAKGILTLFKDYFFHSFKDSFVLILMAELCSECSNGVVLDCVFWGWMCWTQVKALSLCIHLWSQLSWCNLHETEGKQKYLNLRVLIMNQNDLLPCCCVTDGLIHENSY